MKALKFYSSEEDNDVAYLAKRIVRAMKKSGQFQRKRSGSRKEGIIKVYKKCGKPRHFIKNHSLHKMDYQEYLKLGGDKENRKDQVWENSRRKTTTDYAIKQALAAWGDSSNESDKAEKPKDVSMLVLEECEVTYDSFFSLIENIEDE